MRGFCQIVMAGLVVACGACATSGTSTAPILPTPNPGPYQPIPLDGFADGIHHWQNVHGNNYRRYEPQQIVEIANNILLYQRNNGGWVENQDPARILNEQEQAALLGQKDNATFSFDNHDIYSQVEYLAAVYTQTGDARYRDASLRGLGLIFRVQDPKCGGWPHTVPGTEVYHPYITMADDVTSGILTTLRKLANAAEPYRWADEALQMRAARALKRGDECILRLQVRQDDGRLSAWAGQYHPRTLEPVGGRSFELASVVSWESVQVVRYLMDIPHPSVEQVQAIQAAISWFNRSAITGWRLEQFPIDPPIRYTFHTAKVDRRLVADPAAPRLWARFYDLRDNSVVLANRDGKRVTEYSQIHHERRTGYAWYTTWPEKMLTKEYPAWKARMAAQGMKVDP